MGKWVWLVVVLALGMGGCGVLDWATGAGTPESPGADGESPVGIVAPLLNSVVPYAGTILAGLAGLYAEARRRKWKAAAEAQAEAIYEVRQEKDPNGNIPEKKLIEAQIKSQEEHKVRDLVRKVVEKIES